MIRIPESIQEKRRIEFRLPSPQTDITDAILFLMVSILYGIKNNLMPPEAVYCNTETTDLYQKTEFNLSKNVTYTKDKFEFYTIVDSLILQ